MSRARGVGIGIGIAGILGVGAMVVVTMRGGDEPRATVPEAAAAAAAQPAFTSESPVEKLADGVRQGSGPALSAVLALISIEQPDPDAPPIAPEPLNEDEAAACIELIDAMRAGYSKFNSSGRIAAINGAGTILDRHAVEGVPGGWTQVLKPGFDVLASGLSDRDPEVRIAAMDQVGHLWVWSPGRAMTLAEEKHVASWKEGFHPLVVRRLEDAEGPSRAAAVRCLGLLPIDEAAEPAVVGIEDPDFGVRFQTLLAFADRARLLPADAILPLLHDPVRDLGSLAERVLKGRGLTQEQVGLGKLITHARADMRVSAIPLMLRNDDIDPVVWLLHLTEDIDPSVRLQAVEALADHITPEVQRRLRELAAADESEDVRAAASRITPDAIDHTAAALPPLPGTPSLNPRAN